MAATPQETTYLWAAHAQIERALDNLRVAGEAVEEARRGLEQAELVYEFPAESQVAELAALASEAGEKLSSALQDGMARSASLKQTLLTQEKP